MEIPTCYHACYHRIDLGQGFYIKGLVTPANIVYFRFKATSLAPPGDAGVRWACGRKLAWATREVVQRLISRI